MRSINEMIRVKPSLKCQTGDLSETLDITEAFNLSLEGTEE